MNESNQRFLILRLVRQRNTLVLPRIGLSIASGLLLAGVAFIAAWMIVVTRYQARTPNGFAWGYGRIRDDHIAVAMAIASVAWLGLQYWIWGRLERGRWLVRAVVSTLGVAAATIVLSVTAAVLIRPDEEAIVIGVILIGGAATVLIWANAIMTRKQFRPVVTSDNLVDVRCPQCQYSLIGLRDLRCPECGTNFTIDELIRAQGYGESQAAHRQGQTKPPPITANPDTAFQPVNAG